MRTSEIEIIGICGPSCSGKTTLARELSKRLFNNPEEFLSGDEYDLYPDGSEALAREIQNPTITNWEDPKLFDNNQLFADLSELKRGNSVNVRARSRDSLVAGITTRLIRPQPIIIVEGIFTFFDPRIRELIDSKFFVDIDLDTMVTRRTNRPHGTSLWDTDKYIQNGLKEGTMGCVMTQKRFADTVLDGREKTEVLTEQVLYSHFDPPSGHILFPLI